MCMHKIHQKKSTNYPTQNETDPEADPDSGTASNNISRPDTDVISDFNINSVHDSTPASASSSPKSPSAMTLPNILHDFYDTKHEEVSQSSNNSLEIEFTIYE